MEDGNYDDEDDKIGQTDIIWGKCCCFCLLLLLFFINDDNVDGEVNMTIFSINTLGDENVDDVGHADGYDCNMTTWQ